MLIPEAKKSPQKRLAEICSVLPEAERKTLLDFAEFLASRCESPQPVSLHPEPIPRPEEESVVAALKRLRLTYPMLDHSRMLHEASALMSQHMIQGREAVEVIDELEVLFRRDFERFVAEQGEG